MLETSHKTNQKARFLKISPKPPNDSKTFQVFDSQIPERENGANKEKACC